MNKRKGISEIANLLSRALRHKIGSIVFEDEFYAAKYARDFEILLNEPKKVIRGYNFNSEDKAVLRESLGKKLFQELKSKDFLSDKKFDIMDEEIQKLLTSLNLI